MAARAVRRYREGQGQLVPACGRREKREGKGQLVPARARRGKREGTGQLVPARAPRGKREGTGQLVPAHAQRGKREGNGQLVPARAPRGKREGTGQLVPARDRRGKREGEGRLVPARGRRGKREGKGQLVPARARRGKREGRGQLVPERGRRGKREGGEQAADWHTAALSSPQIDPVFQKPLMVVQKSTFQRCTPSPRLLNHKPVAATKHHPAQLPFGAPTSCFVASLTVVPFPPHHHAPSLARCVSPHVVRHFVAPPFSLPSRYHFQRAAIMHSPWPTMSGADVLDALCCPTLLPHFVAPTLLQAVAHMFTPNLPIPKLRNRFCAGRL
eukprot:363651-Chlamydomonas_euryale.AAC.10